MNSSDPLREALEALIDIWDDGKHHPDNRAYVSGSFAAMIEEARATLTTIPSATEPAQMNVTEEMLTRFLSWKLPSDFMPDAGITFKRVYNESSPYGPSVHEPTGTNLLTADQARAMLEHVLSSRATEPDRNAALTDEQIDNALRAWVQAGKRPVAEAMRCAIEAAIATRTATKD